MKRSGKALRYTRSNAPRIARAANAIGAAYKAYKSRSQTKTKTESQKQGIQGITTFQKDYKTVYRYKRAPRRLRRKWKRSRRTFISNLLKQEGSRKYHYHGSQAWTTAANTQGFFGWFNNGVGGTGGVDGSADLYDVFNRLDIETRANGTGADAVQGGRLSRRYYMDHMRSRVVLTNTGTNPIFWEIYECTSRKDIPTNEFNNLSQMISNLNSPLYQATLNVTQGQGAANSGTKTNAAGIPSPTASGVTPFQYRHFCQNFKVNKVTRLQASAGNTVSFDASTPRNTTINWDDYASLCCKKYVTKLFLVRQWGAVTAANPDNSPSSAVFEVERDYNVKLLDTHVPELNYITYMPG